MKKMKIKHIIAMISAIFILLTAMTGCANIPTNDPEDSTPAPATTDPKEEPETFDPFAHLGDTDEYRDSEFCILNGCTASWFTRNSVISDDVDGEPISYAIARRNARVLEKYGVKLTEISDPDYQNSVDKAVSTNTLYFDVAMITLMHVYPMAQRHLFFDYNQIESVDLTQPWWDQNAVEDLSVAGKLYFCTGSFDITRFDSIRCLAFNKDLLNTLSLESPYDLVDNGKWTIDKFIELASAAKVDYGNDNRFTDEDTYGLASYDDVISDIFMAGCGIKYLDKNADDEIVYDLNMELVDDIAAKVCKIMHEPGFTFNTRDDFQKNYCRGKDTRILEDLLVEGRTLFYSECLANTRYFRESSINYGIVPPPKYDETQQRYYSIMINPFVYCIPSCIADAERTGFLMDAYMAASHDTVVPAYYDITLVGKIARDPETVRMLGIVFDSLSYNIHISSVTVRSSILTSIKNDVASVSTALKRYKNIIPNNLKKVNDDIKG